MVQDTSTLSENEALIQEMLRRTPVEVPTEIEKNPVIHKGDETMEAPVVLNKVSSAGYLYLWDTETKERVPILYYMLPQQMRKKRADGQFRFSGTKPVGEPWKGTTKCLLHKDNPQRAYFDSIGYRVCKKENIASSHALTQHMRLKHPQEWKQIEDERAKKEKEEDRNLQRAILENITKPQVIPKVVESKPEDRVLDPVYLKRVENMAKAREARKKK